MKKAIFSFVVLAAALMPLAASAQSIFWDFKDPLLSCTANDLSSLPPIAENAPKEQCKSFCDLLKTGQNVMRFGLTLALLVIAPIMFLLGGILIMIARGNKEQYSAGIKTITGAAAGAALILVAFVIVNTFFYLVGRSTEAPGVADQSSWFKIQCSVPPA